MPLTLTDQDLAEVSRLLRDFRHGDAITLTEFLNGKIRAQQLAEVKAMPAATPPPAPTANGHADHAPTG